MNVRLYFRLGMPARAALRIISQRSSIWRSRSGVASRTAGFSEREISFELSGSGTMSSAMPNDSTRSRKRERPSTDQASSSFADGRRLQMWVTPKPAIACRIGSESPCCVPTFMAARRVVWATDGRGPGVARAVGGAVATRAAARASAAAPIVVAVPVSRRNLRRSMVASVLSGSEDIATRGRPDMIRGRDLLDRARLCRGSSVGRARD